MPDAKVPQMTTCSRCNGWGVRAAGDAVLDCTECEGGGVVEARDERGRFLPWLNLGPVEPDA